MLFTRMILSLFIIGFVLVASCSKDSSTNTPTTTSSIKAKVDGTSWDGSAAAVGSFKTNQLLVSGQGNGMYITIVLYDISTTGTYQLGVLTNNHNVNIIEGSKSWLVSPQLGSGTVTVSTLTATEVTGTFSFTAPPSPNTPGIGTKTVTEGTFSIKLTQI